MGKEDLLKGKRVLAVDDEPDVLETLEELLPMCDLVKATTADEAIQQTLWVWMDISSWRSPKRKRWFP